MINKNEILEEWIKHNEIVYGKVTEKDIQAMKNLLNTYYRWQQTNPGAFNSWWEQITFTYKPTGDPFHDQPYILNPTGKETAEYYKTLDDEIKALEADPGGKWSKEAIEAKRRAEAKRKKWEKFDNPITDISNPIKTFKENLTVKKNNKIVIVVVGFWVFLFGWLLMRGQRG